MNGCFLVLGKYYVLIYLHKAREQSNSLSGEGSRTEGILFLAGFMEGHIQELGTISRERTTHHLGLLSKGKSSGKQMPQHLRLCFHRRNPSPVLGSTSITKVESKQWLLKDDLFQTSFVNAGDKITKVQANCPVLLGRCSTYQLCTSLQKKLHVVQRHSTVLKYLLWKRIQCFFFLLMHVCQPVYNQFPPFGGYLAHLDTSLTFDYPAQPTPNLLYVIESLRFCSLKRRGSGNYMTDSGPLSSFGLSL